MGSVRGKSLAPGMQRPADTGSHAHQTRYYGAETTTETSRKNCSVIAGGWASTALWAKTPGGPSSGGAVGRGSHNIVVFTSKSKADSHSKYQRKISPASDRGRETGITLKYTSAFCSSNKAQPQGKLVSWSLTSWCLLEPN